MLRSISVFNFVHFINPQRVDFEDGANFIIGGNSTGKSAILELIRRCLSNKISTTTTSIPNENKLAYAICHFIIPSNYPTQEANSIQPDDVITCLFVNKDGHIDHIGRKPFNVYKALIQRFEDKIQIYVQHFTGYHGCNTAELKKGGCKKISSEQYNTYICNILDQLEPDMQRSEVEQLFKDIEKTFSDDSFTVKSNMIESMYDWLERGYVGVLPMRSIGPLQWTKSKMNKHNCRQKNYNTACERAEIITKLFDSDRTDKDMESEYNRNLVDPYKFEKMKNCNLIQVRNQETPDSGPMPLLKTPEGILEAKQLTLILANKDFFTITFEEPDRGMHPHMIKKMRDLILKKIKGKTVIIISHNPSIIDPWSLSRTFVCSKTIDHESKHINHFICKVPKDPDYAVFGRIEEMKYLLFSSRILFVEGITDKIILEAVFSLLINDTTIRQDKPISDEVKQYLLGTEILELSSHTHGNKKKEYCNRLRKENFVLYDADVFEDASARKDTDPQNGIIIDGKQKAVEYHRQFKNREEFRKKEHFAPFENACYDVDVFCWKNGAIEMLVIDVLDQRPDQTTIKIVKELIGSQSHEVDYYIKSANQADKKNLRTAIIKKIKKCLPKSASAAIENLARQILHNSVEIWRLITFLERKMTDGKPTRKRHTSEGDNNSKKSKLSTTECCRCTMI